MGKKIARGFGYFFCAVMIILCIILIIAAAAFQASDTVGVFGFNIFIVRSDDIPTAPKDSAIIVNKCEPYEVTPGKLLLYTTGEEKTPTLGYAKDYYANNGVYYVIVSKNGVETDIPQSSLVGKADYCSAFLGAVIGFIKTPFGIFCIAVLPCVALILYDIIRAAAAKMPPPEVVPQVKNMPEESPRSMTGISVGDDGKGTYSRTNTAKASTAAADDVLFSYAARQRKTEQRPIIPLTDRKAAPEPPEEEYNIDIHPKNKREAPKTPAGVAVSRYAKAASENKPDAPDELPEERDTSDAFFTQSKVPQLSRIKPLKKLPAAEEESEPVGKRSTRIIANKRVEDLMSDDDDDRDRSRYGSEDFFSGTDSE